MVINANIFFLITFYVFEQKYSGIWVSLGGLGKYRKGVSAKNQGVVFEILLKSVRFVEGNGIGLRKA